MPGVSYTIEIFGGSSIHIPANDILRVTKEDKIYLTRKSKPAFHYRERGYFFQFQTALEILKFGPRLINGYKFGRFCSIGIGSGIEITETVSSNPNTVGGGFIPIYLYYSGDILRKQLTPYYTVELGYAMQIDGNTSQQGHTEDSYTHNEGGLMGGIGIGYKYYSRKNRFNCAWSVNADFTHVHKHEWGENYMNSYSYSFSSSHMIYSIGTRLAIGF